MDLGSRRRRRSRIFRGTGDYGIFLDHDERCRMLPEASSVSKERFCEINLVVSLEGTADGAEIDCWENYRDVKSIYKHKNI